jgi:hypothetical protein
MNAGLVAAEREEQPQRKLFLTTALVGHGVNVGARDAEVGELVVGKTAQLVDGVTVAAPVAVIADQVHFHTLFCSCGIAGVLVTALR